MGRDKLRHLLFLHGRWRWCPSKSARAHGFRMVNLTAGLVIDNQRVPSAVDKARAIELNRARRGIPGKHVLAHGYPAGSIGDGYMRAMRLREAERTPRVSRGPRSSGPGTIGRGHGGGSSQYSLAQIPRQFGRSI